MKIRLEFKLQDFWVGIFWKNTVTQTKELVYSSVNKGNVYLVENILDIWICLIPCLPIHITKYSKPYLINNGGEG